MGPFVRHRSLCHNKASMLINTEAAVSDFTPGAPLQVIQKQFMQQMLSGSLLKWQKGI